jgi:hypothetical protein
MENLTNCEIFLGPCSTSIYMESIINSTVYALCHQLRIHNCATCFCYVKVRSHPIIEDCKELKFAPYNLSYSPGIEEDIVKAGLQDASCWDNVVDFRWLKTGVKSPNWDVLREEERRPAPVFSK